MTGGYVFGGLQASSLATESGAPKGEVGLGNSGRIRSPSFKKKKKKSNTSAIHLQLSMGPTQDRITYATQTKNRKIVVTPSGYTKELRAGSQGDICTSMHMAALFSIARGRSNPCVYWWMNG